MKIRTTLVAAAASIGLAGALASSAQASYPSCTTAGNYVGFNTASISDFLGNDTAFQHQSFTVLSCLTNGDNQSVQIDLVWDGRNFGGAGNPEDVTYRVNVYNEFVSCDGKPQQNLNMGILHATHHHAVGLGGSHSNDVATACT